ncbi:MAG: YebC/PmpR family DNA-binding transcriptional regulator [Candidatus Dadabacteria bacterium]|nr:YebC/PmpR family DNA-binding transcriptional regulator [Candidatus Dadabacteria bacterium]MYA47846.1 YebC/PmpR family DNA-binding transcriptional regulator [Candidatus Dadabacteria bacterium]MYF47974.1 YebC/PmpR family DNA-binding transcriptional regulator [Candidatus Dadabacteria bacterium]MYG83050.1 YebC/PmpR family DNA-binding transcriptional regulator [Candidatus Dadabacteria bacterium]MYK49904.1 YebC/PmpR family DNA-binding transcriptional regulator [Candidatus Dadabacteria bacterium]
MAGHSKWANIKHRKAAVDAKRGKIFTKVIRELTVAAKEGGGDPEANPRLRTAVATAKGANMPNDTIERAIKRGTGDIEGVVYNEIFYEGYGPGGSAVYVKTLTDNRNRTVSDIRRIFTKHGGGLGENGCVAWMFDLKGRIAFEGDSVDEDALFDLVIDAGADDVRTEDSEIVVITPTDSYEAVKKAVADAGIQYESAEVTMIPQTSVRIEGREAEHMIRLMEALEDSDDVQNVYANFDIDEQLLEAIG